MTRTHAPSETAAADSSLAAGYVRMLIAKAASQAYPDMDLLDRIETFMDEAGGRSAEDGGAGTPLKTSYVEMLIERAGLQDDPDPELLNRIERHLGQPRKPRRPDRPDPARKRRPANGRRLRRQGAGHPEVPPNHYRGLGPTAAYRKFVDEFGTDFTAPQIRNALIVGGLDQESGALLTTIHGIRRRDRLKREQSAQDEDAILERLSRQPEVAADRPAEERVAAIMSAAKTGDDTGADEILPLAAFEADLSQPVFSADDDEVPQDEDAILERLSRRPEQP